MKHNKRFLLTAVVLLLAAVFCYSAAMAAPLTEIKFAATYPAETWKANSTFYGQACMWDYLSLDSYLPADGDLYISWTSSDKTIAEPTQPSTKGSTGISLRVYKPGKVSITAQALDANGAAIAGVTATAQLEYVLKPETSVTFDQAKYVISKNSSADISWMVNVEPADASYGVGDLTWTTSDSKVVVVTNEGTIYALNPGTAIITATAKGAPTVKGTIEIEVKQSAITSLKFSETALTLPLNMNNFPLYALLEMDGAGTVVYSSSDTSIVDVNTNGTIFPQKAGTATITASSALDPTIKAECTITISEKPVNDITFSQAEYSMYKGQMDQKIGSYTLTPADGDYYNITFKSQNPEIVDGVYCYNHMIYADAYSVGTATIDASVRINDTTIVTKSFKVNVTEFAITSLAFSKPEYKLNLNKKTNIDLLWRLIVKPDDYTDYADVDADDLLIWSSSDDTIATVDASGEVKARNPGKATITVKYSKNEAITASADVVIDTTPVKTLALSKKELTLSENMHYNQSFYAQVEPADAYVKEIYYEVVDPEIASINCNTYLNQPNVSSSKVAWFDVYPTGKAGTTDIKVYVDDGTTVHEAVLKLTVVKKEANLVIVDANSDETPVTSMTLPLYKDKQANKFAVNLDAILLDDEDVAKGSSSEYYGVSWKSSDPKILTVDRNGIVTVKKEGKATVTATMKDGTKKSASVTLKVVKNLIKKITGNKKITLRVGDADNLYHYLTLTGKKKDLGLFYSVLKFTSSNDNVVSVNESGLIYGNQTGEAKITVQAQDGSKKKFEIAVKVVAQMQ